MTASDYRGLVQYLNRPGQKSELESFEDVLPVTNERRHLIASAYQWFQRLPVKQQQICGIIIAEDVMPIYEACDRARPFACAAREILEAAKLKYQGKELSEELLANLKRVAELDKQWPHVNDLRDSLFYDMDYSPIDSAQFIYDNIPDGEVFPYGDWDEWGGWPPFETALQAFDLHCHSFMRTWLYGLDCRGGYSCSIEEYRTLLNRWIGKSKRKFAFADAPMAVLE